VSAPVLAVTGATGLVGHALVRRAIVEGWQVRALTRSPQPAMDGVTWVSGSLETPEALLELVTGSDAVVHVAGVVNAPDRAGFEAGNVAGTLAIVEAARKAGVARFIHVSSLTAREPELSHYGWSKAKAETIVAASGLDWTMIRPPAVYGPGDRDMLDMYRIAKRGFVLLPPAGQISVIEVSDLARLLLAVIPVLEARAQIYEADDGRAGGWSYREYGKAIGWAVGKPVSTVSAPRALLQLAAWGDRLLRRRSARLSADRVSYFCHPDWVIDPAKRPPPEIWQPAVKTREGLKATAAAYRAAGWL
jgi:uncharacterized protein YbjT (DUF2867 family)